MKPTTVNILGITYKIEYVDKVSDVDIYKRASSMWGQIDFWTRSIRVYANETSDEDIFSTILHEVLEGIAEECHLTAFKDDDNHDDLDLLALALADVLVRNKWIDLETQQ